MNEKLIFAVDSAVKRTITTAVQFRTSSFSVHQTGGNDIELAIPLYQPHPVPHLPPTLLLSPDHTEDGRNRGF